MCQREYHTKFADVGQLTEITRGRKNWSKIIPSNKKFSEDQIRLCLIVTPVYRLPCGGVLDGESHIVSWHRRVLLGKQVKRLLTGVTTPADLSINERQGCRLSTTPVSIPNWNLLVPNTKLYTSCLGA